jgi:hypothetical protein
MKPSVVLSTVVALWFCVSIGHADSGADIFDAAGNGDLARVAALLDASPELVYARNTAGETPLHSAVLGRQTMVMELLLALGADPNAADVVGRTPLHFGAGSNNAVLMQMLITAGASASPAEVAGETPLHVAARRFDGESLRVLIAAGADVNALNQAGQTPLHVLGRARPDIAEDDQEFQQMLDDLAALLIDSGADPRLLDNDGRPAWPHEQSGQSSRPPSGYPTYTEIDTMMHNWASQRPDICRIVDVGTSVQGRHQWALNISDNPGVNEDEPEFKYIATLHGNEVVGTEMCLYLIDYLLTNYGTDPRVTNIVNELDTWIIPLANPDGYMNNVRENANGVDLNRNFPEWVSGNPNTTSGRAIETANIMNWSFAHSFTLAANFHTGALVVNYPFDNDGIGSLFAPSPDQDLYFWISEQYSQHNSPMWNSSSFPHGITNGAEWYTITGGMQDWDYRYEGGHEVTIELSTTFGPPFSQIPTYWSQNRESMLAYMETCLVGVRGIVTDASTGVPLAATVTVVNRNHATYTDPTVGDYHRMLLAGSYQIHIEATGYDPITFPVVVSSGAATRVDVAMRPVTQLVSPNGGETLDAGRVSPVSWTGGGDAQFHAQYTANFGQTGTNTEEFESGTLGAAYTTGGSAGWIAASGSPHTGTYSARAGAITHSQVTWLTRPAQGGSLSFWYKVSSESGGDVLSFYIDNVRKFRKSGTVAWTQYTATLTTGAHTLRWEYAKDSSVNTGSDTAWIDDVVLIEDQAVWTDIVALTDPGDMSALWSPPAPGNQYKVRVQAYYADSGAFGAYDDSDATFAVVTPAHALGDLNCDDVVNGFDIDAFVLTIVSGPGFEAYYAQYPNCDHELADCNQDGLVNAFDIDPFVSLLVP